MPSAVWVDAVDFDRVYPAVFSTQRVRAICRQARSGVGGCIAGGGCVVLCP